jgi:hypothetical protein
MVPRTCDGARWIQCLVTDRIDTTRLAPGRVGVNGFLDPEAPRSRLGNDPDSDPIVKGSANRLSRGSGEIIAMCSAIPTSHRN